ncbi:LysM peptidoglycan-binding domain-containing protein [Oryzifoliimicrobium ureilyticus]|uniref:LysM peptidoglycan-binding domain-containing protein n=1 Tax=Oryzifoliimicrobium ureilyticus TaxID=3113724 RepID=UPI0030765DE3
MAQPRHTVVSGDTLWDISKAYLGNANEWPRIWRYNNRRDVIAVTGREIKNPDLIYPGQVILIPVTQGIGAHRAVSPNKSTAPHRPPHHETAPGKQQASTPSPQPMRTNEPQTAPADGPLSRQLPHVKSPVVFKYKLDDIKFPPIAQPGVIIEMKMTGSVLLSTKENYPAIYVTQREVEVAVTQAANNSFNQLVSKTNMIYEPGQNKLTLRSMLVSQSKNPNLPTFAVGTQVDSHSPMPKLRFEIKLPKLEGTIGNFLYLAEDVAYVIELTPQPTGPRGPSAQPVRNEGTNWQKVIGTGLIVVAGAIVVGTLIEDLSGVGIADDPASFAAAGASYARGISMLRGLSGARMAGTVLPRAAIPAALRLELVFKAGAGVTPALVH